MNPTIVRPAMRAATAAAVLAWSMPAGPASAFPDTPAPKVDCSKKKNRNNPACKPGHGPASDDELYNAAYWQAKAGRYQEALTLLARANQNDPRVLSYQGFATRKLGNVDAALVLYEKALAINPDYTVARAYMGEAFLTQGDAARAREQLGEIEQRCGKVCAEYADLATHIATYEAARAKGG
jgi:tetratricopeptide (TPR) repeat protein